MSKAEEMRERWLYPLNVIQTEAKEMDRYILFYTHSWEQKNEEGQNILVLPNDPRFDEEELGGLCIDMIMDYYEKTGREIKGSRIILGMSRALKKLYEKGFPEK